jgi:hypothetical protein
MAVRISRPNGSPVRRAAAQEGEEVRVRELVAVTFNTYIIKIYLFFRSLIVKISEVKHACPESILRWVIDRKVILSPHKRG